jgi:hypothetical protein
MSEPSRLEAILGAVESSIRDPRAVGDRSGFLAAQALDPRDEAALAELEDSAFLVYRKIIRRSLASAIAVELPRTAALLGSRFDEEVDAFLSEGLSASHYLRDVAFELVERAARTWPGDASVPAFALDLARHELSAFKVASMPRRARSVRVDASLDLDAPCVFDEAATLERYLYPIHELAEGQTELAPSPTALLVYRDREHEPRYLKLSPVAATLVERALRGEVIGEAIRGAAAAHGAVLDAALLEGTAKLLADLAERGVLLGRPANATTMRRP